MVISSKPTTVTTTTKVEEGNLVELGLLGCDGERLYLIKDDLGGLKGRRLSEQVRKWRCQNTGDQWVQLTTPSRSRTNESFRVASSTQ